MLLFNPGGGGYRDFHNIPQTGSKQANQLAASANADSMLLVEYDIHIFLQFL